jgi:HSP20 family protein
MNELTRHHDPFDLFSRFGDLHDRDSFFAPALRAEWMPPVDIKETPDRYTFQMEVPGMQPDDLDVEIHDGVLSVRGTRKEEKKTEDAGYVRVERRFGNFSRQFRIPATVRAESLKAELKDGVLHIEVPKGSEDAARKVKIS